MFAEPGAVQGWGVLVTRVSAPACFPRWADTLPSPSEARAEGQMRARGEHSPISGTCG